MDALEDMNLDRGDDSGVIDMFNPMSQETRGTGIQLQAQNQFMGKNTAHKQQFWTPNQGKEEKKEQLPPDDQLDELDDLEDMNLNQVEQPQTYEAVPPRNNTYQPEPVEDEIEEINEFMHVQEVEQPKQRAQYVQPPQEVRIEQPVEELYNAPEPIIDSRIEEDQPVKKIIKKKKKKKVKKAEEEEINLKEVEETEAKLREIQRQQEELEMEQQRLEKLALEQEMEDQRIRE